MSEGVKCWGNPDGPGWFWDRWVGTQTAEAFVDGLVEGEGLEEEALKYAQHMWGEFEEEPFGSPFGPVDGPEDIAEWLLLFIKREQRR
tara:strand:- start:14226 stop:14489 length:264 start_codon:yes stop_codon:yes gene_type:complete